MIESAVNFGPDSQLVGIYTEPHERWSDVAVVLLNAGLIHRAGPNRVHVRLARALAAVGVPAMRIDMAGIGDSQGLGTTRSQDEECLQSIRGALDVLESRGTARRFVLYGACAGAFYALRYARGDARVVGIAGIDPPTLDRSRKYYVIRMLGVVRRPVVWYRFLRGHYNVMRKLRARLPQMGSPPLDTSSPASGPRDEAGKSFAEIVRRQVQLLLVITSWGTHRYNYRSQLYDLFPGLGLKNLTKVALLPAVQHTFSSEADRRALESELLHWIKLTTFSDPVEEDSQATREASPS